MASELSPKLFDIIKFQSSVGTTGASTVRIGTIVELFGSDTALVEISDETGVSKELVPISLRDIEVVWSSSELSSKQQSGE